MCTSICTNITCGVKIEFWSEEGCQTYGDSFKGSSIHMLVHIGSTPPPPPAPPPSQIDNKKANFDIYVLIS